MRGRHITTKVDVWAVGILLFVLVYKEPPFDGVSDRNAIATANVRYPHANVDTTLLALMRSCLSENPDDRPTAEDIRKLAAAALNHEDVLTSDVLKDCKRRSIKSRM